MRKFKIVVIGHQLKNQFVAPFGTEVDESQLNGNADALVKAGFIEEIGKADEKADDSFDLDKMKVDELKEFAKINGIELTATKKDDIIEEIEKGIELLNASDVNDSEIVE